MGGDWRGTFGGSGESERSEGADEPKHLLGDDRVQFPCVRVGPQQFQCFPATNKDLLLLAAREIAVHGLVDARGLLQRQCIEMHLFLGTLRSFSLLERC